MNLFPCEHCGQPRDLVRADDVQKLNRRMPLPGVALMVRTIQREHGDRVLLLICLDCACFVPAAVPAHAHSA
jgi:hypothetical protein